MNMYDCLYMYTYVHLQVVPPECTASFHNFKSQNFKLSVSNPKIKYVAYVSVLSQISNCQSLGRKNKHEILKTDRTRLSVSAGALAVHKTLTIQKSETYVVEQIYIYIYIYVIIINMFVLLVNITSTTQPFKVVSPIELPPLQRTTRINGWKINYPEIGYPEFCQLIEQENRDPNKALGQSIKITVYLEFAF